MTITEEHIKASLISAVEDKLRRRIQERVNQHEDEMIALRRTKHDLNESRAKINEVIASLEREEVYTNGMRSSLEKRSCANDCEPL